MFWNPNAHFLYLKFFLQQWRSLFYNIMPKLHRKWIYLIKPASQVFEEFYTLMFLKVALNCFHQSSSTFILRRKKISYREQVIIVQKKRQNLFSRFFFISLGLRSFKSCHSKADSRKVFFRTNWLVV